LISRLRLGPVAAAVLLLGLAVSGARAGGESPRLLRVARVTGSTVAQPTLAGREIVWGEDAQDGSIAVRATEVGGTVRTLFRAKRPVVPPDATDASFRYKVAHVIGPIAGSSSRIAFLRLATLVEEPRCRPACGAPTLFEPLFNELWIGSRSGDYRRLAGGPPNEQGSSCRRVRPTAIDVAGSRILYAERVEACEGDAGAFRESRLMLVSGRGRPQLILRSRAPLAPVAIAGHFAAWGSDVRSEPGFRPETPATVTVYDLERRRILYRVGADALRSTGSLSFDLQPNGTIAIAAIGRESSCLPAVVAWASLAAPRPHVLRVRAAGTYLHVARNLILLSASGESCGHVAQLSLADLEGRVTRLASFSDASSPPAFLNPELDFDGRRFTIAVARTGRPQEITSIYIGAVP
jgi:hypothetical protein